MTRGEIYRTSERAPERGAKAGFYVVVSRAYVAENDDVATVICAPVYSRFLGLSTEVAVGPEHGLPHSSSVRCDFLALMFKRKLTSFVGALTPNKLAELDGALRAALDLG